MYGLVNKAIEDLVVRNYGDETWTEIAERAGFEDGAFVSMDPYPDAVTYDLVGAASAILETPVPDLLQAFGEHWMRYTAREGYGDLLDASGDTLPEFLDNLDGLQARLSLSFPELEPPSFRCEEAGENKWRLHYYSGRDGLGPMVVGLLRGLAGRFELNAQIDHCVQRNGESDHDVFEITLS